MREIDNIQPPAMCHNGVNPTSLPQPMTNARLVEIEQLVSKGETEMSWDRNTTLGMCAIPELIAEIRRLQAGLLEACDWANCESGEGIIEQRAAVIRLRALVGG